MLRFFQKSQLAKNDSDLSSDSLPSDVSDSEDDKSPFKLKVGHSSEKKLTGFFLQFGEVVLGFRTVKKL